MDIQLSMPLLFLVLLFFFFNDTATTEIYTLSLHDALPISSRRSLSSSAPACRWHPPRQRSEEHTSELQSPVHLVCRLLLEKKNTNSLSWGVDIGAKPVLGALSGTESP